MKLALFKISAFALPLLIGTEAIAFPGAPPPPPSLPAGGPPGGGGLPGGGLPRGGPPPGGGFNRPSVPGGGFRGAGGVPRPPTSSRPPNISRPGSSRPGGLAPNNNLAGGGPKPRTPNISRPGSSQPGGLAPKSNLAGGGNKQPQLPSKVQSLPKGSGSVLPSSIAQGNKPGPGPQGKGFPDLSGKGPAQLVNRGLGGTPLLAQGKLPGVGPEGKGLLDPSGKGPSELFNKAPDPLANQEFWKSWSAQNHGKLAEFQANRVGDWNNISDFRNNQNIANSFNQPQWNDYKNNVQNYWDNRAVEVNNNIKNSFDNNFSSDWWKDYGSYADKYASYADKYWDKAEKYWWWGTATYATAAAWLYAYDSSGNSGYGSGSYDYGSGSYGYGSGNYNNSRSRSYDYGVNVVYEDDDVYADGKRVASAKEYSQQAITLANTTEEQPRAPMPPDSGEEAEYLPLGVWAMVQEDKGDAYMFFQISIDKDGVVTGAFKNLLSGETSPISGQVDKKTQRVAWKIGSNSSTVIEAGLQNLTQDVASCLVHFGTDTTQTWLLVRLKDPATPNAHQSGPVAKDSR
jgi:hypothetical protein